MSWDFLNVLDVLFFFVGLNLVVNYCICKNLGYEFYKIYDIQNCLQCICNL